MKNIILLCCLLVSSNVYSIKGFLITDIDHIDEVAEYSNSFGYFPKSLEELKEVLIKNENRMLPLIDLSFYFLDENSGIFVHKDVSELKSIINKYKIVTVLDEPFWNIRMNCINGYINACLEVESNFKNTRKLFTDLKFEINTQILHIESFEELKHQIYNVGYISMLDSADHIAFDCYGNFNNCGGHSQMEYLFWLYMDMKPHQRIFLIPGGFSSNVKYSGVYFENEEEIIEQLEIYQTIYETYTNLVSGIGIFVWSDVGNGIKGLRNLSSSKRKAIEILQ